MKLSDFKIKTRVSMALILPIIGLLAFTGYISAQEYKAKVENTRLYELTSATPNIGLFVHELQKERALTVIFINSTGEGESRKKLEDQRANVDKSRESWEKTKEKLLAGPYDQTLKDKINAAEDRLKNLSGLRADADGFKIISDQAAKYFTETNASYLDIISLVSMMSTNAATTKELAAYDSFLLAKERAGVERATGANGFSKNLFAPALFQKFIALAAQQDAFLNRFKVFASTDVKKTYADTMQGPVIDDVERMRKVVADAGSNVELDGSITGPYWVDAMTKKINLLKTIEDKIEANLLTNISLLRQQTAFRFIMMLSVSGVLLLMAMFFGAILVRSITRPMAEVTHGLKELANDNLAHEIKGVDRADEIGDIAKSMLVFKKNALDRRKLAETQEIENKAKLDRAAKIEHLINDFDQKASDLLNGLASASTEMEATSQSMTAIAAETSKQSSAVASAASQAGANVQNVASATEELTASIKEIAHQMTKSSENAMAATSSVSQA